MRKTLIVISALLAVSIPVAVVAVTLQNGTRLDRQRSVIRSAPVSTSRTKWAKVPGLQADVCSIGWVSENLSVQISGAAVNFRIVADGIPIQAGPKQAHFDPSNGTNSFSFTFTSRQRTFEGSDGHLFEVLWRSPTGKRVTMNAGSMTLQFAAGSC